MQTYSRGLSYGSANIGDQRELCDPLRDRERGTVGLGRAFRCSAFVASVPPVYVCAKRQFFPNVRIIELSRSAVVSTSFMYISHCRPNSTSVAKGYADRSFKMVQETGLEACI